MVIKKSIVLFVAIIASTYCKDDAAIVGQGTKKVDKKAPASVESRFFDLGSLFNQMFPGFNQGNQGGFTGNTGGYPGNSQFYPATPQGQTPITTPDGNDWPIIDDAKQYPNQGNTGGNQYPSQGNFGGLQLQNPNQGNIGGGQLNQYPNQGNFGGSQPTQYPVQGNPNQGSFGRPLQQYPNQGNFGRPQQVHYPNQGNFGNQQSQYPNQGNFGTPQQTQYPGQGNFGSSQQAQYPNQGNVGGSQQSQYPNQGNTCIPQQTQYPNQGGFENEGNPNDSGSGSEESDDDSGTIDGILPTQKPPQRPNQNQQGGNGPAAILGNPVVVPITTTPSGHIVFPKTSTDTPSQRQCVQDCSTTSEYNPVCGSNNVTYFNPGRFICARNCGINVFVKKEGKCNTNSPL